MPTKEELELYGIDLPGDVAGCVLGAQALGEGLRHRAPPTDDELERQVWARVERAWSRAEPSAQPTPERWRPVNQCDQTCTGILPGSGEPFEGPRERVRLACVLPSGHAMPHLAHPPGRPPFKFGVASDSIELGYTPNDWIHPVAPSTGIAVMQHAMRPTPQPFAPPDPALECSACGGLGDHGPSCPARTPTVAPPSMPTLDVQTQRVRTIVGRCTRMFDRSHQCTRDYGHTGPHLAFVAGEEVSW